MDHSGCEDGPCTAGRLSPFNAPVPRYHLTYRDWNRPGGLLRLRPLITAVTGLPVRFYWPCTPKARRAFFRKLAGDGRVKAVATSLAAVLADSLTGQGRQNGPPAPIPAATRSCLDSMA
ncbi:hypothetical protein GCM10009589_09320 [Arthrobacter pascens]